MGWWSTAIGSGRCVHARACVFSTEQMEGRNGRYATSMAGVFDNCEAGCNGERRRWSLCREDMRKSRGDLAKAPMPWAPPRLLRTLPHSVHIHSPYNTAAMDLVQTVRKEGSR